MTEIEQPIVPAEPDQPAIPARIAQADRLIELAFSQNADLERLEQLFELKQKFEADEARKQFARSMVGFKAEGLVITKDKRVYFEGKDRSKPPVDYMQATIGNVVGTATPLLALHGFSHKWEHRNADGGIEVACVLTHVDGHIDRTDWLFGVPDNSGGKNPLQAISSTISYLERYTFLMITGIAVKDQGDDDGQGATPGVELINEDQENEIHARIEENNLDMDKFLNWLDQRHRVNGIDQIPAELYDGINRFIDTCIENAPSET